MITGGTNCIGHGTTMPTKMCDLHSQGRRVIRCSLTNVMCHHSVMDACFYLYYYKSSQRLLLITSSQHNPQRFSLPTCRIIESRSSCIQRVGCHSPPVGATIPIPISQPTHTHTHTSKEAPSRCAFHLRLLLRV